MWILLGILAIPLIEIGLFVTLGAKLGLWLTLAWVLVTGVFGVILLRGVAMLGTHDLASGVRDKMVDPMSPIAHRVLVGIAGLLLLLPGFFTDTIGILLLFPPIRRLVINFLSRRVKAAAMAGSVTVVDGEWRDVTPGSTVRSDNPPSDLTRH
jgi:UPF0716 protein FxsA